MKRIAVTGRSGCGKSSLSGYLREKGYTVIDADVIAREIMLPPSPCLDQLAEQFGADILDEKGELKRRMLADRAFATPQGTQALTQITYPEIQRRILALEEQAERAGEDLCFVDGAVIVDTPLESHFDAILLVAVPTQLSVERICARDGITPQMALRRLEAQTSPQRLEEAAWAVIRNTGTLEELKAQADLVLEKLRSGH